MRQHHLATLVLCLCGVLLWTGCFPGVLQTDHEYILAVREGDRLVQVSDDSALYARFDETVLVAPELRRLLMVYEHTTEAFIATNEPTRLSKTIANLPIVVLDGDRVGALRDIVITSNQSDVKVELAIGLGLDGERVEALRDMALARERFAPAMAQALLHLMGLELPESLDPRDHALHETTNATTALACGYGAALQAISAHGQGDAPDATTRDLVARNRYRYLYDEATPTAALRTPEQATLTPGVVATYLYRLCSQADGYYPQTHMLWFANYEGDEVIHGKMMLALGRMAHGEPASIDGFVSAYRETFPGERERIEALYRETFGGAPPP